MGTVLASCHPGTRVPRATAGSPYLCHRFELTAAGIVNDPELTECESPLVGLSNTTSLPELG